MKRILLLPLLFVFGCAVGQDVSVKWRKENVGMYKTYYSHLVDFEDKAVISEDASGNPVFYDIAAYTGFEKYTQGNRIHVGFLKTASKAYITGAIFKKKQDKVEFYMTEISSTGKTLGQPVLVTTHSYYNERPNAQGINYDESYYVEGLYVSKNGKFVSLITVKPYELNAPVKDTLFTTTFDENLKVLCQRSVDFYHKDTSFAFPRPTVTDNGTLLIFAEIERYDKFDKKTQIQFYHQLWIVKPEETIKTPLKLENGAFGITECAQSIDESHIIVAGFYTTDKNEYYPVNGGSPDGTWLTREGTFALKIELTSGKIVLSKKAKFGSNVTEREKGPPLSHHMMAFSLEISAKGEMILVAASVSWSRGDLGDEFYFTISPDLEMECKTIITNQMRYSSHYVVNTGDKIWVLYNQDDPKPYKMMATLIDFNGKEIFTKNPPLESGFLFSPGYSYMLSKDKIVVVASTTSGNKYRFGILTLK